MLEIQFKSKCNGVAILQIPFKKDNTKKSGNYVEQPLSPPLRFVPSLFIPGFVDMAPGAWGEIS